MRTRRCVQVSMSPHPERLYVQHLKRLVQGIALLWATTLLFTSGAEAYCGPQRNDTRLLGVAADGSFVVQRTVWTHTPNDLEIVFLTSTFVLHASDGHIRGAYSCFQVLSEPREDETCKEGWTVSGRVTLEDKARLHGQPSPRELTRRLSVELGLTPAHRSSVQLRKRGLLVYAGSAALFALPAVWFAVGHGLHSCFSPSAEDWHLSLLEHPRSPLLFFHASYAFPKEREFVTRFHWFPRQALSPGDLRSIVRQCLYDSNCESACQSNLSEQFSLDRESILRALADLPPEASDEATVPEYPRTELQNKASQCAVYRAEDEGTEGLVAFAKSDSTRHRIFGLRAMYEYIHTRVYRREYVSDRGIRAQWNAKEAARLAAAQRDWPTLCLKAFTREVDRAAVQAAFGCAAVLEAITGSEIVAAALRAADLRSIAVDALHLRTELDPAVLRPLAAFLNEPAPDPHDNDALRQRGKLCRLLAERGAPGTLALPRWTDLPRGDDEKQPDARTPCEALYASAWIASAQHLACTFLSVAGVVLPGVTLGCTIDLGYAANAFWNPIAATYLRPRAW